VRVLVTDDLATQDKIIRATNSQNKMQPASLRMTDQIHRDIEEFFKKVDLFYDRRRGHYRDQGRPIRKVISVNTVVQSVISILLQRPDDARARPGDYFKDDNRYALVFDNPKIPVSAYLTCVQIVQRVEQFMSQQGVASSAKKNLKFYVAAMVAREVSGLALPVFSQLPSVSKIDDALIEKWFTRVGKVYVALSKKADGDSVARGPNMLKRLDILWKKQHQKGKDDAKEE
jgi:hypothetical protein